MASDLSPDAIQYLYIMKTGVLNRNGRSQSIKYIETI